MARKKFHRRDTILFLFILILSFPVLFFGLRSPQDIRQHAAGNTITFTPQVIPVSSAEIGNPGRGPEYYGGEAPPPNWPQTDAYARVCWSQVEPTENQYNFSSIENALARAKKQGGMGGFRIMSLNTSNSGSCVPSYLQALMPKGWTSGNNYVPDWNDPNYIARGKALFQALAAKYANDPRLGWIDMSLYGNWSEWHTFPLNYPGPTGAQPGTNATLQAIIDFETQAFPNTRFLMLTANSFALNYAIGLQRPIPVGERRDCLGVESLTFSPSDLWKTRPIYGEYCGGPNFQKAQNDIVNSHISMIGDGDGNLNSFNSYSTTDQNLMMENYKTSGYRIILDNVTVPSQIGAGGGFTLTSKWSNVNVAPPYLPWNVMFQLKNASGTVAWQGKSSLDLRQLLPTTTNGTDTPMTVTDTLNLSSSIPNGTYTLGVQIVDPNNYYPPLQLAIQGKQSDGSYPLGTVTVGGSPGPTNPTQPPTTTPAITNGPTPTPGGRTFSVTVCPHGLGNCGDNVTPGNGGNTSPQHQNKNITITISDNTGRSIATTQGTITYNQSSQNFQGLVPTGNVANGQYLISIKVDGFLSKQVPGIISVSSQQTISLPSVSTVTGDINNDNQLDLLDYNLLISCFGSKQSTALCTTPPTQQTSGSDINDDGKVDGIDYNLFIRELSVQKGSGGNPSTTPVPTSPISPTSPATPTPTVPTSASNYPASDGTIMWDGGFETGNTSQWSVHAGGAWGNSSVQVVQNPVRWGKYAAELTINAGGSQMSGERAEISSNQAKTGGYPNQEWFYSWSSYLPSNPNQAQGFNNQWNDFTQWMDLLFQCSPPIGMYITTTATPHFSIHSHPLDNANGCASLGPYQEFDLGAVTFDAWNDFTVHIKWSTDPTVGFIEVWRNGQHVLPLTHLRTLDTGGGVYMEQAFYRGAGSTGTNIIYHDGTRRHTSYAGISVPPNQ